MELNKELFEDVIVYQFSELGAMGPAGTVSFLKKTGECFVLDYTSDETPWEDIKANFPGINGCRFNGPQRRYIWQVYSDIIGIFKRKLAFVKNNIGMAI